MAGSFGWTCALPARLVPWGGSYHSMIYIRRANASPDERRPMTHNPARPPGRPPQSPQEAEDRARLSLPLLSLLALALGVITGFGAVLCRDLIGLIHNLAFTGRLALH